MSAGPLRTAFVAGIATLGAATGPLTGVAHGQEVTTVSAEMEDIVARLETEARAHDYVVDNKDQIGFAILEGRDARDKGEEFISAFDHGIEKMSGRAAKGFLGNNGDKATEVTFYIPYVQPNGGFDVTTYGPYNIGDAANVVKNWQNEMAPSYTPVGFE